MVYCSKCGQKMEDDDNFCSKCGTKLGSSIVGVRTQVIEGSIHKCPNCGETINAFSLQCPSCGHEFRDSLTSSAIREFEKQLKEIEDKRPPKSFGEGLAVAMGISSGNATDEQKMNLIRSFSVPNTKEDVFEFMILASSNIDESLYENNAPSIAKNVSNAWIAKTDQVFNKAKVTFGKDPDFSMIKEIYENKMRAVNKSRRHIYFIGIGVGIGLLLIGVVCFLLLGGLAYMTTRSMAPYRERVNNLESRLTQTVNEIQEDIANEDYDAALIKANTLYYDSDISSSRAEDWDKQREALIKLIEQKKETNNEVISSETE